MARSNKYASLNFNDIYEKKISPNTNKQQQPSSQSIINSKTIISNSRIHGNMLVLSRPTSKTVSLPSPSSPSPPSPSAPSPSPPPQLQQQQHPDQITRTQSDSISLRPLGRTGSGPTIAPSALTSPILGKDKELAVSPKTNRFVPPHLRPGFVGREVKPETGVHRQAHFVSPSPYEEEARPKSGGGHERTMRGFESNPVIVNRPGSSGTRPNSCG